MTSNIAFRALLLLLLFIEHLNLGRRFGASKIVLRRRLASSKHSIAGRYSWDVISKAFSGKRRQMSSTCHLRKLLREW